MCSLCVLYSYITAASMAHVGRDGLMEKLKELNIETLSVEHPEVRVYSITAHTHARTLCDIVLLVLPLLLGCQC